MARGVIEEVEEVPAKGVLMGMHTLGYTFILTALAAAIAWIVFVAKAANGKGLGNESTDEIEPEAPAQLETVDVCFQALVVSVLFYFVARHHFSHMHQ